MDIFTLQNDLQHSQPYDSFCLFRGYFGFGICAMIIYSLLLQAISRYVTAVYLNRLFWQSQRTQIILICASWIFRVLLAIAPVLPGSIIYYVNNQPCQILFEPSFPVIFAPFCTYICISCINN